MSPELISYGNNALNWLIRISPLVSFAAFVISWRAFKTSKDQKHNSLVAERWNIYQEFREKLLKRLRPGFYEIQNINFDLQYVEISTFTKMSIPDFALEELLRFFPKKLVKALKRTIGKDVSIEQYKELEKKETATWLYAYFKPWLKHK